MFSFLVRTSLYILQAVQPLQWAIHFDLSTDKILPNVPGLYGNGLSAGLHQLQLQIAESGHFSHTMAAIAVCRL